MRSSLELEEGFILDLRWESFPAVSEIILNEMQGRKNISLSVQGASVLSIEYCYEDVMDCGSFEVEFLNPGIAWNHYSVKLDKNELVIHRYQQNYSIHIRCNPVVHDMIGPVFTSYYLTYGIAVRNLNVTMLHELSQYNVFIKKIKAKDGIMKLHDCAYLFLAY